jgi:hypothetical protein
MLAGSGKNRIICVTSDDMFQIFGYIFWCWVAVELPCLQRVNLLKSVADVSWGAHPSCLILLYTGLIRLVLEYGSVCFKNMAKTYMLRLERVQYRALRILLGLSVLNDLPCCCFLSIGPTFEVEGVNMGRCI